MSNSSVNLLREPMGGGGRFLHLTVGTLDLVDGIMVSQLDSDATLVAGSTASSGDCIGVTTHHAAALGTAEIETDREFLFANATAGDACSASTPIGWTVYMYDDHTIADNSNSGARKKAGIFMGMEGTKVRVWIHPGRVIAATNLEDILLADAGQFTATDDPEAALQEIYQHLLSATGVFIPLSLHQFREVDANGDVGAITANGGILASDTTPIMRGNAAETTEIYWAANNSDPISTQVVLPPDFSGAADVKIELWVYSGTTDAASFNVETGWDGGALVSDTADDTSTKSATLHKLTATVAAADIPNTARLLTLALTPPAHTTDAIGLLGVAINGKRTLLAA